MSLAAEEFVWNEAGLTHAHSYILPPVVTWLLSRGANNVLDLGCGNGAFTAQLAHEGFKVTGLDSSDTGISIAARSVRAEFVHGNLESGLPERLKGRFDAVIAIEVIEHLLRPRVLFQRAKEALRPGGMLVVSTPFHGYFKNLALALTNSFDQHWHPLRDFGHVKFFSKSTLTRLFAEQGFEVTAYRPVGRIPALAKSMVVRGELLKPA